MSCICMAFHCLIALLLCVTEVFSAVLTVAPVSVTTTPYTSVNFTCEGIGDQLTWLVESSPPTNDTKQSRNIMITDNHNGNNLSSVLTITALPGNDKVGIGCRIISSNPFEQVFANPPGNLMIEGVTSVEDLDLTFTSSKSLYLSWSPPIFYSNDVPPGSPITYQVTVTDETGDIVEDRTISDTSVVLDNITKCDTFNVSVIASVAEYSSVRNSAEINGSYSIDIEDHSVVFMKISIFFKVACEPTLCDGSVSIEPSCDGCSVTAYNLPLMESNEKDKLFSHNLTHLKPYKHYVLTVKVKNLMTTTKAKDSTMISTYHVQGLTINNSFNHQQYTNGSVRVKCQFVEGSKCHVLFNDTAQKIEQSFNITGTDEEIVTLSVSGNYTVTAYDLVNGTIIGPSVVYPTPVEIIQSALYTSSPVISSSSLPISNIVCSASATPQLPDDEYDYNVGVTLLVSSLLLLLLLLVSYWCVAI